MLPVNVVQEIHIDDDPDPDPLQGATGVVASVLAWPDGRGRGVVGLDSSLAADSGHFVASVNMVLGTLLGVWSDVVKLDMTPLRTWAVQSGGYWIVGSGQRAWVIDPGRADIGAILNRLGATG